MRTRSVFVCLAVVCLIGAAARAGVLLTDDFNDNTLNTSLWQTNTAPGGSSVIEQNQRVEITARGHLNTVPQFNPVSLGGLRVSGQWTYAYVGGDVDFWQLLTRSDGVPNGGNYWETTNGVQFAISNGTNQSVSIGKQGSSLGVGYQTQYGTITISQGDTVNFDVIDNGRSLYARITSASNPSLTAAATARVTSDTYTGNRLVAFHNRENNARKAYLDNVTISSLGGPPTLPLADNFDSNTLDLSKWMVINAGIPGSPQTVVQNGRVEITGRSHFQTFNEVNPDLNPIMISGRWTFANPGDQDFLQIEGRSDGLPSGSYGETANGVEFFLNTGGNVQPDIRSRSGAITVGNVVKTGSMTLGAGDALDFTIIDNRGQLSFLVTKVGNPAMTASVTATILSDNFNQDFIAFHNREGGRTAYLDNLTILEIPEPVTITLLALASTGLGGYIRRRRTA